MSYEGQVYSALMAVGMRSVAKPANPFLGTGSEPVLICEDSRSGNAGAGVMASHEADMRLRDIAESLKLGHRADFKRKCRKIRVVQKGQSNVMAHRNVSESFASTPSPPTGKQQKLLAACTGVHGHEHWEDNFLPDYQRRCFMNASDLASCEPLMGKEMHGHNEWQHVFAQEGAEGGQLDVFSDNTASSGVLTDSESLSWALDGSSGSLDTLEKASSTPNETASLANLELSSTLIALLSGSEPEDDDSEGPSLVKISDRLKPVKTDVPDNDWQQWLSKVRPAEEMEPCYSPRLPCFTILEESKEDLESEVSSACMAQESGDVSSRDAQDVQAADAAESQNDSQVIQGCSDALNAPEGLVISGFVLRDLDLGCVCMTAEQVSTCADASEVEMLSGDDDALNTPLLPQLVDGKHTVVPTKKISCAWTRRPSRKLRQMGGACHSFFSKIRSSFKTSYECEKTQDRSLEYPLACEQ